MSRTSNNILAEAEVALKDAGYDYPLAWAMQFLSHDCDMLVEALIDAGKPDKAKELQQLVDWIDNGDPVEREEESLPQDHIEPYGYYGPSTS